MKQVNIILTILIIFGICLPISASNHKEKNYKKYDVSSSLQESQQKFAQDVVLLLNFMLSKGYKFTFGETMRTKEQAELYAQQGKGIKNSLHCKRLAIDINLFDAQGNFLSKSEDHALFGKYWEHLSPMNRWGGKFSRPDGNHYERNESW